MKYILRIALMMLASVALFSACSKKSNAPATPVATIPTITTNMVSSITNFTATSGGQISSDGGAAVTVRGVIWDTGAIPTIALSAKTSDGTGTGGFASSITGLSYGTTYHVRAYATNSAGTAYGSILTCTTTSVPTVGMNYGGGTIFYMLQSGDPGYDASVLHGLISTNFPVFQKIGWGCSGTLVGASGTAIGTGKANTAAIVAACGAATAAYLCDTLTTGGYTDWFLPSNDELKKLYTYAYSHGGCFNDWCWSSTESNIGAAYAQSFYFSGASQLDWPKNSSSFFYYSWPVRSF